jgi:adenosylmethionine-8-amino-7-oxononanoate aminotransferase
VNAGIIDSIEFDKKHIWHPYTSIQNPLPVYHVASAHGVRIKLTDGRELIDGMSSWWSVIHGYSHPEMIKAIQRQAETLSHVMFGGFTHQAAIELAKKLIAISPAGLERVFFCDSGSVAVEVAMKMAIQYYYSKKRPGKNRFLTIKSGYHGDTFHAMSVCDPTTGMHKIYHGILPEYLFADKPQCGFYDEWDGRDIDSFEQLIRENHDHLCGVILEPIVQGAGGMRFYHSQYLKEVRELCSRYDVLLIADEIATGFGRTGKMFACEYSDISPDILCLGKALTGGYLSLAAVLASDDVGQVLSTGEPGVFMHGPTFMGNPLACSVACCSIDLLLQSPWQENIRRIEAEMKCGLAPCNQIAGVRDVRILGGIGVVELEQPVMMERIQEKFVQKGVWVRPFGRLVYIMPPYVMSSEDLQRLTQAICEVVEEELEVI